MSLGPSISNSSVSAAKAAKATRSDGRARCLDTSATSNAARPKAASSIWSRLDRMLHLAVRGRLQVGLGRGLPVVCGDGALQRLDASRIELRAGAAADLGQRGFDAHRLAVG